MRPALASLLLLVAGAVGVQRGVEGAPPTGEKRMPKEAEKVLDAVAGAFKKADASGVCGHMEGGDAARLYLSLAGVTPGAYTREQATEALAKTYFASRAVVALTPGEDCTSCDEWSVIRTYRLRTKVGEQEKDGTLTVQVVRRPVGEKSFGWFLTSLKE